MQEKTEEKPKGVITLHSENGVGTPEVITSLNLDGKELSPDSIMGVGSIGKMFTRSAIYLLAQDGKIDLEKPAIAYFQGNNDTHQAIRQLITNSNAEKSTLADLLNHTSGLPCPDMPRYVTEKEKDMNQPASVNEVLSQYMKSPESDKPVGKRTYPPVGKKVYNNINYMILGQLIEDQAEKPFQDVVHERVIEPLGLKHTGYVGHKSLEGQDIVSPQFNGDAKQTKQALAAGSLFTTATELDTFMREYSKGINGGKEQEENKLFTPETLKRMHNDVREGLYGNYDHKNKQVIELGHAGGTTCFGANVQHNPTNGKTNVTMLVKEESAFGINIGPEVEKHHNREGHSIFGLFCILSG